MRNRNDGQEVGAVQHRQREQDADLVDEEQREHQHQAGEQVPGIGFGRIFVGQRRGASVARARRAFLLSSALIASGSSFFMQLVSVLPKRNGPKCGRAARAARAARADSSSVAQLLDQGLPLLAGRAPS